MNIQKSLPYNPGRHHAAVQLNLLLRMLYRLLIGLLMRLIQKICGMMVRFTVGSLLISFFSLLVLLLTTSAIRAQMPVQVQVSVMQPVSPYLPQLAADITGGHYGQLEESLTKKLLIQVINTGQSVRRIKLSAKIERLSPTPASVTLRPDYQPSGPIILAPNQVLQLDRQNIEDAFGNFSRRQLQFNNLSLSELRQNAVNYKLPEGIYRVCVTAYDFDKPGQTVSLSAPGTSCAVFRICYSAAAPQFTMPVSTLMAGGKGSGRNFTSFTPHSAQIQFAWTQPSSTCGLPLGMLTYDFEIRQMFPGQVISDGMRNPVVFQKRGLTTNMFLLDTLRYPHVLQPGRNYIIRVKANTQNIPGNPIEITNQGYSEIAAITYAPKSTHIDLSKTAVVTKVIPVTIIAGLTDLPSPPKAMSLALTAENGCTLKSPLDPDSPVRTADLLPGDSVSVGDFVMVVSQATRTTPGETLFKGSGMIMWQPFGHPIKLNVVFENIRINERRQLLAGQVTTSWNMTAGTDWLQLSLPDYQNKVKNLTGPIIDPILKRVNNVAHLDQQFEGKEPVDFPLGLNNQDFAGVQATLAITGIIFTSRGTDMRMLFSMNIPGAGMGNEWLSLCGAGFCINPTGLSMENGLLYLPSDRSIDLGDVAFTLKGAVPAGELSELDTTQTTYLKWNGKDGFEKLFVKAEVLLPAKFKAVNKVGVPTGERVKMKTSFAFREWNDWMATLEPSDDFEIEGLKGFTVSAKEGLYYDHSLVQNPTVSRWPSDENGHTFLHRNQMSYQGLYMQKLSMQLPADFISSGITRPAIDFSDLFLSPDNGLWVDIQATDLLKKGTIGEWAFTIDTLSIPIKEWMPQKAKMTGTVGLPISSDQLEYECLLNSDEEEGLNYAFFIHPPKDGVHVPFWAADFNLDPNSVFTIQKDQLGAAIQMELNGKLNVAIEKPVPIAFTALTIQGMQMGNRKEGKNEFYFMPGNIHTGSQPGNSTAYMQHPADLVPGQDPGLIPRYALSGPSHEQPFFIPHALADHTTGSSAGEDRSVGGFGVSLKSPKPLVGMDENGIKVGMSFELDMNLGFGSIGLAGQSKINLFGYIDQTSFTPKPEVHCSVDSIALEGKFGPVEVSAALGFMHDDVWGEGIRGAGSVSFPPGINITANVVFGTAVQGFKYFGFGASVYDGTKGLAQIGPLVINGFGGGYYHNLQISQSMDGGVPEMTPSENSEGIQASLALSYIQANVLKGKATLTVDINNGAPVKLEINGEADVVSDGKEGSAGLVHADLKMRYKFDTDEFDAFLNAKVKVIVAEACVPIWLYFGANKPVPAIETAAEQKTRHSQKSNFDYYLYIGCPDGNGLDHFGKAFSKVTVTLWEMNTSLISGYLKGEAYFCIGSILPKFPPLPDKINKFLGYNDKSSNENSVINLINQGGNASGFMFGAQVAGNINLDLAVIHAYAEALVGFDVALLHITNPGSCQVGSSFGMNNWYAIGQVYAYFAMGVDLHIDVGLFSGNVTLAKLQVGAAIKAGMPNPTWMNGRIRIVGEALGGMVHVNQSMKLEIGDVCIPEMDPLASIKLIAEVGPSADNASVFAKPYVIFNLPMDNKPFKFNVMDKDGNETTRTFRFKVDQYKVTSADNGYVNQGTKQFSTDGYTMTIWSEQAFKEKMTYKITVHCKAEEFVNNKWQKPTGKSEEEESISFTTGIAPDTISERHVVISYPMNGQNYFLKNEFNNKKAMVVIDQFVEKYFTLPDDPNPLKKLTIIDAAGGQPISTDFSVRGNDLTFNLPGNLKNSTTYRMYFSIESSKVREVKKTTDLIDLQKPGETGTVSLQNVDLSKISVNTSSNILGGSSNRKGFQSSSAQSKIQGASQRIENSRFNHQQDNTAIMNVINEGIENGTVDPSKISEGFTAQGKEVSVYQPSSGRIIYQMIFRTSQFNTFADKMASFGSELTSGGLIKESGVANESLVQTQQVRYNTQTLYTKQGPEGFDEWEIKGQVRTVGEVTPYTYTVPPLLFVKMGFDLSVENDKSMNALYSLDSKLNNARLNVDYGAPQIRALIQIGGVGPRPEGAINIDGTFAQGHIDWTTGKPTGRPRVGSFNSTASDKENLSIVYERDKYYAYDLVLLKSAADAYVYYQSQFSSNYEELQKLIKDTKSNHSILSDIGFSQTFINSMVDAIVGNSTEKHQYDKFITNRHLLAKTKYGSVQIKDGQDDYFWLYGAKDTDLKNRIQSLSFKPLPSGKQHPLIFTYGLNGVRTLRYQPDQNKTLWMNAVGDISRGVQTTKYMRITTLAEEIQASRTKTIGSGVDIPFVIFPQ